MGAGACRAASTPTLPLKQIEAIKLKYEPHNLTVAADGTVRSSEGWAVRLIAPDLLEYCQGPSACLVNVDYVPARQVVEVYASESTSELFPRLHEHLQSAMRLFSGRYI